MKTIIMLDKVGKYAENKDIARDIRVDVILPSIRNQEKVILDFLGVETATQSFVHALISESLKQFGNSALDYLAFKSCNDSIKQVISIVVEYMQDAIGNQ